MNEQIRLVRANWVVEEPISRRAPALQHSPRFADIYAPAEVNACSSAHTKWPIENRDARIYRDIRVDDEEHRWH